MSEEGKRPLINAEKIVFAKHIERLIIYEGEKPLTAGDMLSACQLQVQSALYNARHKYDPNLYVERAIEQELNAFADTSPDITAPNCYLLIAPAGSGKTNLLCHLAQIQVSQRPTMLLMGGSLYLSGTAGLLGGIRTELEEASEKVVFRSDGDSLHTLHRLGEEFNRDTLLLIDAINEYDRPAEMRKALQEILRKTRGKRIKLLVTCRDYYWGLFKGDFWEDATVNDLTVDDEENSDTEHDFNLFSADEHKQALALYLNHYGIIGQPVGNAAEQCRHPLLLRFFCEAYRGQDIGQAEDIRLKELFDRYWEQKLGSIANRMIRQGDERLHDGLAEDVGEYLLRVASHMLHENVRAIPLVDLLKATQREEKYDDPRSVYGRIRDEFIILEEKELGRSQQKLLVAFVYEEFMEYVMARSLVAEWNQNDLNDTAILAEIEILTQKYTHFAQILGVVVYLALMLKETRDLTLWSLLLTKGEKWQEVVFEAFRKLPEEQLDSSVFSSLEEMLHTNDQNIYKSLLDLLKLERVGRAASASPSFVNNILKLTKHKKEQIARRAVLALGYIEDDRCIPVLIDALDHQKESVRKNATTALQRKGQTAANQLSAVFQMRGGSMRSRVAPFLAQLGWVPSDEKNLVLYHLIIGVKAFSQHFFEICDQLGNARVVTLLIEALQDSDLGLRTRAAWALGQLGDARAVPALIDALGDTDWHVRRSVIEALGQLGHARAVPPLIEALKGRDLDIQMIFEWVPAFGDAHTVKGGYLDIRAIAAAALGQIGDARAVPALIEVLKASDRDVQRSAIEEVGNVRKVVVDPRIDALKNSKMSACKALGQLGDARAVPALIEMIKDSYWDVRKSVAKALEQSGSAAVPALIEALKNNDRDVRRYAAEALGQISDVRAVPALIEALQDRAWDVVRQRAVDALRRLGNLSALDVLLESLLANYRDVRRSAAQALGFLEDPQAVPALIKALEDNDRYVRKSAAEALGRLGDARAVPALIEALKDSNWDVQESVTEALEQLGDARAVPVLIQALKGSAWDVRRYVAEILKRLNDPRTVHPLVKALKNSKMNVAHALGQLGDARAVPPLIKMLQDSDQDVQGSAVKALGMLGKAAIQPLIEALQANDWYMQRSAVEALGQLGEAAVPALIEMLQGSDRNLQTIAAEALGQLGDMRAIPPLIEALKEGDQDVQRIAAEALGQLGDVLAVPALIEMLKEGDRNVQRNASKAVEQSGDDADPLLIEMLQNRDRDVRKSIAEALGQLGDARAVPALVEMLKDRDRDVRKSAGKATMTTYILGDDLYNESFSLGTIGGEILGECGVSIYETIGAGEPKKVSAVAIWLSDKNDIKTTTKVVMTEHAYNDPNIRTQLDPKAEVVIVRPQEQVQLETSTLQLRATVVDIEYGTGAMPSKSYFERITLDLEIWAHSVELGDVQTMPHFINVIKDSRGDVRRSAARSLGQLGDERAVPAIIEALKDSDEDVRKSAIAALGQLGDVQVMPHFIEALKDTNRDVRMSATKALGSLEDARAVPPLLELLKDSDRDVRKSAVLVLGQLGDAQAVRPLTEVLKDSDRDVRKNTVEALQQLGNAAVHPLLEALKDNDRHVRKSAADALIKIRTHNVLTNIKKNTT